MKPNPLAKHNRLVWRRLIFTLTMVAACSFFVGLFWPASHSTQQRMRVTASKAQTLPTLSHSFETTLNLAAKKAEGSKIFPINPHRKKVAPAKAHDLFSDSSPEISKENRLQSTEVQKLVSASPKPEDTIQPPSWNPEPPKTSLTPPVGAVQESQIEAVSKEIPEWERQPPTFRVPTQLQAKIVKSVEPVGQEKVIALTFDDGPSRHNTSQVLDILKQKNIKATFFWIGQNLKAYPKIAQQIVADGHAIGNHTWHHWYHKMDWSTAAREIDDTAELIHKTVERTTSLFRPPGGVMDNGVTDYAKKKNYLIVMWSIDSVDYRQFSARQLVKNVMGKVKPGAIVLMHDGGGNHSPTVAALPQIISKLQELGYRFVTIPELLELRQTPQLEELRSR